MESKSFFNFAKQNNYWRWIF